MQMARRALITHHSPKYLISVLLFSICFLLLLQPSSAIKRSYVVYLGAHSHGAELFSDDDDLSRHVVASHYDFLESYLESREEAEEAIFYSYKRHINGFAAYIEDHVAADIAKHPKVVSVFLNQGRKLQTTRSWDFLGLHHGVVVDGENPSNSLWKKARFGADTIIANLDTGVWPESKSFRDGGEYGPIPSKWKGTCQFGADPNFHCNRKLIGARYYNKGYASATGPLPSTFNSPRDYDGHGTHTLSTAAGNFVPRASIFNYGKGTAKGGSPNARVAAYKVCWPPVDGNECFDADILAAFDDAIHDGVDVLSVSLGAPPVAFFNDSIAIGSFHAVKRGIVVVCSAGNSGPTDGTVANVAPWEITVGASTIDREFASYVVLGDRRRFKGESLSTGGLSGGKFYPLISAANARKANSSSKDAFQCKPGTLDRRMAKGKIVVCIRGGNDRVEKSEVVAISGGVGMIIVNDEASGNDIVADAHVLPASHINYIDGLDVLAYIHKSRFPKAYITQPTTLLGVKPAPYMAAFSSKGPNTVTPEILKPDITAPGVNILAAYTEAVGPTNEAFDKRRVQYNTVSGTSMSCPHISGIAGLLKSLYPGWSSAAIRSAIMTTATTLDNNMEPIQNASYIKATPFSYGAGQVSPNRAMDPGLIYDLGISDYLEFLCALGYNQTEVSFFSEDPYKCPKQSKTLVNLNYPSITVPNLSGSVTVTRRVKNVGPPGVYRALVQTPDGISVFVEPKRLKFTAIGEEKSFKVTLELKHKMEAKEYEFGELAWSDGKHYVRSPIVVKTV